MLRIAVVGGGISGLACAYAIESLAARSNRAVSVILLEKDERLGGKIWSRREEGYLCEWGPNGFLDNKPMTLDLCRQLGIEQQLLPSDDNARKRFIYSAGQLHRLPENGPAFLRSPLISWPGKLRLAAELFVPQYNGAVDETLAEFARRRLGSEALEKLIAPMVSGIFAGDPETMSLKSCFPRIHELERDYGGLLRAMLRLARQKKQERKAGKAVASAAGPGGVLTSFSGGIQDLTDTLGSAISGQIMTGKTVASIGQASGGYRLQFEDGGDLDVERVVIATPAYATARMLESLSPKAVEILDAIPYAPMNVVCFGYRQEKIGHDLDGFGYLIPGAEGCSTLGTLWDSSIFPQRAPAGQVLLRSMMGGATNLAAMGDDDETVARKVKADLRRIMGIAAEPDFVRVFRHAKAIPQYIRGHAAQVERLVAETDRWPGLVVTGNAYYGVGLNDCVRASTAAAERVLK